MQSFHEWLDRRPQEVPDLGRLALLIARSGAGGMSGNDIEKALGVPFEMVDDVLRALVSSGQVVVVKANGEMRYRAAM